MTKIPVSVALRGLYNAGMEWNGGCESCGSMEIVSECIRCDNRPYQHPFSEKNLHPLFFETAADSKNHRKNCSVPSIIKEWIKEDLLDFSEWEKYCAKCGDREKLYMHVGNPRRKISYLPRSYDPNGKPQTYERQHKFVPWHLPKKYLEEDDE